MKQFDGKRILVTGGTGSLGRVIVNHLVSGEFGVPEKVVIFSRDETKQFLMRSEYSNAHPSNTDAASVISDDLLSFRIGDIRSFRSVRSALRDIDIVFNTAALKQVPNCEYFPHEAVQTNVLGVENIIQAIHAGRLDVATVVGISTDKACKPVNVMGMTKALQERLLIRANLECDSTKFICVRYGNVLASRGSVIPYFCRQIRSGGPVTITDLAMTRFLLDLRQAVTTIFAAVAGANPGETYIPRVPSAKVVDIATSLIGSRPVKMLVTGVRPGEKIHESLISEEEAQRTVDRGEYYAILPLLPEISIGLKTTGVLGSEYSSADSVMSLNQVGELLAKHKLTVDDYQPGQLV